METWYRLRVQSTNEAGATEAEYAFSTAHADHNANSMAQPGWSISDEDVQWINIVIFPILATIIVVGCFGVVIYGVRRKPRGPENGKCRTQHTHSHTPTHTLLTVSDRSNLYIESEQFVR